MTIGVVLVLVDVVESTVVASGVVETVGLGEERVGGTGTTVDQTLVARMGLLHCRQIWPSDVSST